MDEIDKNIEPNSGTQKQKKTKKNFFKRRSGWFIIAAILALIILVTSASIGVAKGINDRVQLAKNQAAPKIQAQLEGARLDIEEGRYEVALDRLNWILDEMTEFLSEEELADVGDLYSQTLVLISNAKTPTPQPSPTAFVPEITPTPDTRGAEDLFNSAQSYFLNREWNECILTILALRENDITFRTVHVDGMLFLALRNRGIEKIIGEGSLEPGIYDLTLSERFGPLDSQAEGIRTWTRLYLTGASFWGIDWSQVVFYFEQVYPHLPNLHDGTFMTARERFRLGAFEFGKELLELGEYCQAHEMFQKSLEIASDSEIELLAQQAGEACWESENNPPSDPEGGERPAPTVKPPIVAPTATPAPSEEPTVDPTIEPTEGPTLEPTPEPDE